MKSLAIALLFGVAAVTIAALLILLGIFDVAADVPHSKIVWTAMQLVRDRSIAARVKDIRVPSLDDRESIEDGARHYAEMCVGCHLSPDRRASELRDGLYPKPPDLSVRIQATPAEEFWVIKHGIKMSAMPAWGATHDDKAIWAIVAFLQTLPELSPERYQALTTTGGEPRHDHHDSHHEDSE
jgi:mono/diheme cytochrome c family protein